MVALIVIYNHKYEDNIPLIEEAYKERFSNIFHLVPFYTGNKSNVISVYENSYHFQGYIAQAFQIIKNKSDFIHYFFIGDDVLLNPNINENTYQRYFNIDVNESFFSKFDELANMQHWPHLKKIAHYTLSPEGLEILKEFPDKESVINKFLKNNLQKPYIYTKDLYSLPQKNHYSKSFFGYYYYLKDKRKIKKLLKTEKIEPAYPIVCGYSDIIIIPSNEIKSFSHYCGLFSAGKLFVEGAIPTAMIMSCDKIKTAVQIKRKYILLWSLERQKFEEKYNYNLEKLLNDFSEDILYIHPVKLSKWKKK